MFRKKEMPAEIVPEPLHPNVIKRSAILFAMVVLLFSALLVRILLLQTAGYSRYQQKVIDQMTTESKVLASRGNIYDANGAILATNITTYRVFLSPSSIASAQSESDQAGENVRYAELIAEKLSSILGVSYEKVMEEAAKTRYLDRTVARGVSENLADEVRRVIGEYGLQRMIYLEAVNTRYYPYSDLASHVIGFTGSDGTGLYGLEYSYNDLLSGSNGRYITARDARGNEMPYGYEEYIEAAHGYHVHSTLNVFVQAALDEQLEAAYLECNGANRAAGIVMEVDTGAVLGMGVYPNFDLNDPWKLDDQSLLKLETCGFEEGSDNYARLKQELLLTMWSNKAITEAYIPGSTFKIITASMALEEDVVKTTDLFTCHGYETVLGFRIHCHKTTGHGTLSFREGIQQSCNPVLMTVGRRVGADRFYHYLSAFGYLEKTGIDLPGEGTSLFISKDDFTELDLAIYSFGQNFNVTLIQQITAVCAVANGGYLVQPHLVSSVTDRNGNVVQSFDPNVRRQVVSTAVCKTVADILEEGVSGNGGAKNAYVAGYRIAAKTGTSEKKNAGSLNEYVCSTVAFAPADDPKYAVIIIVDEPQSGVLYGSTVAAPYVANVMEAILPYLGVEAVYTEEELEKMTVTAPNCLYWSRSRAESYCASRGLQCEVIGDEGEVIYGQYPVAGTVMEKSYAKMIFYVGNRSADVHEQTVTVPDLIGKSASGAMGSLENAGLNIRIKGTKNYLTGKGATVISQSVEAGTQVPRGTVIEVNFRALSDEDMDDRDIWEEVPVP